MPMEAITPITAALAVVFFQNRPIRKTARMPGLTNPVYSWMYWKIWACPASNGAMRLATTKATAAVVRPVNSICLSVAFGFTYGW